MVNIYYRMKLNNIEQLTEVGVTIETFLYVILLLKI